MALGETMNQFFTIALPRDHSLQKLVDYYFYIDTSVAELAVAEEYMIPFPRITFGYFFDHPFEVTNHTLQQQRTVHIAISRLSTHQITVIPLSSRVQIAGAHVRPFALAYLTKEHISALPWLINPYDLLAPHAQRFDEQINRCNTPEAAFEVMEHTFLNALLKRNLDLIGEAVRLIDHSLGIIQVEEVAHKLNVTSRTLRNHFDQYVGCSPKEYIQLVRLKQTAFQMYHASDSLTAIGYDNQFADQAHFANTVKAMVGKSPKKLREDLSHFRFLQF